MQRALKQAIAERRARALSRRRALAGQLADARAGLYRQAARPQMLAVAVGAGFLLGRRQRQRPSPRAARPRRDEHDATAKPTFLAIAAGWALRQLGWTLLNLLLEQRQGSAAAGPAEPSAHSGR